MFDTMTEESPRTRGPLRELQATAYCLAFQVLRAIAFGRAPALEPGEGPAVRPAPPAVSPQSSPELACHEP